MNEKPFKTYDEQIELLKSRGLKITSNNVALKILKEENYYNVINGYKDLFLDKSSDEDKYKIGSDFMEIVALYRFDREIRNLFLKEILKIENKLRSLISYTFSEKYGNDNYLKFDNFETLEGSGTKPKNIEKRAGHIHELIAEMQKDLAYSIDKKEYIKHYMNKYGFIPLWVLINSITFGTLSKFYSLMKPQDQNIVAKNFGVVENDLKQYINILSSIRNLCAHGERIYNLKLEKTKNMPNSNYHKFLKIPINKESMRYENGINDLFAIFIILRILLPRKEFNSFYNNLNFEIKLLSRKLTSISIVDVYKSMGFPKKWRMIRKNYKKS